MQLVWSAPATAWSWSAPTAALPTISPPYRSISLSALGTALVAGYNPDIKFMAHLWEPLNGGYRPLAFYLLVELVAYCSRQYLDYKGFQQHRHA